MSESEVACLPIACSGERYWAVPITRPVLVSRAWSLLRAIPKSVIFIDQSSSSSTRMFSGFTSRCTTPLEWAASSARASSISSVTTRFSGSPPVFSSMISDRGRPGQSSITM